MATPIIDLVNDDVEVSPLAGKSTTVRSEPIAESTNATASLPNKNANSFLVKMIDLPEYILVETKFISSNTSPKKNNGSVNLSNNNNCASGSMRKIILGTSSQREINPEVPISLLQEHPETLLRKETENTGNSSVPNATATSMNIVDNTRQYSVKSFPHNVQLRMLSHTNGMAVPQRSVPIVSSHFRQELITRDVGTMTDDIIASIVKNGKSKTRTTAVQCNRYDSDENDASFLSEGEKDLEKSQHELKNDFEDFLRSSLYRCSNGLYECSKCGEVMKSSETIQNHMSVHWGPPVLCCKCGKKIQHETLMKKHCCIPCHWHSKKKHSVSKLRCPHYRCGVVASSPLELYDHVNEHVGFKRYICKGCYKSFCTCEEYKHHLYLQTRCFFKNATKKRLKCTWHADLSKKCRQYRSRVYNIYDLKGRKILVKKYLPTNDSTCQICLKFCGNKFVSKRHIKKCLNWYNKRLSRKINRAQNQ